MTTNILIVGNGFDLSHYLPTKYDHFMVVMQAIENWDIGKGDMNFDDLFDVNHEKEGWFFQKTKEIYDTKKIVLAKEIIISLKNQLNNNSWYQYFKKHLKEIDTWIDFEERIGKVLYYIADLIDKFSCKLNEKGWVSDEIHCYGETDNNKIFLGRSSRETLEIFRVLKSGYYEDYDESDEFGRVFTNRMETGHEADDFRYYIEVMYFTNSSLNGMNSILLLSNFQKGMDDFIQIFNSYLELIINELEPEQQFKIIEKSLIQIDKIYSFNYTNSYQKFYDDEVDIEFLHGKLGEKQNIVLGIDDLESDELKKLKAYGFTKYHQKLFKDTDYLFLDGYRRQIEKIQQKIIELKQEKADCGGGEQVSSCQDKINPAFEEYNLDLTFYIWGHSLDVSDKDYIIDLFSLNDDIDRNVRVVIYYFDSNAKFSLLNNLLSILKKNKVEHWMKNKWLKFEENPKIDFGI